MKKNLTQKNHGIPALGIKGKPGNKGISGLNLYIGFINDFFDYITTTLDSFVYYTQRLTKDHNIPDEKYKNWLDFSPRTASKISGIVNNRSSVLYYSGEFMQTDSTYLDAVNGIYSLEAYADPAVKGTLKEPGFAINDVTGDDIDSFTHIKLTDVTYIDETGKIHTYNNLYDMNAVEDPENQEIIGYKPKYKIKFDFSNVAYDYTDLKWAAQWALMDINNDDLFDKLFYNYTQVIYDAENDGYSLLETGDSENGEKSINEFIHMYDYDERNPNNGNIINDRWILTDTNTSYVDTDLSNNDNIFTDSTYGNMPIVRYLGELYNLQKLEQSSVKGQQIFDNNGNPVVDDNGISILDLINTVYYFKQPIKTMPLYMDINSYMAQNEYCDEDGYTYTCVHPSTLFEKKVINVDGIDKYYTTLKEFEKLYSELLSQTRSIYDITDFTLLEQGVFDATYKSYEVTLNSGSTFMPANNNDSAAVSWFPGDTKIVNIPTTLSKNINIGDVIYFYVNERDFHRNGLIQYMAVITEDMIGCTLDYLISHAQITEPFEYTAIYTNELNNRGIVDNTTTITTYTNSKILKMNGFRNFQLKSLENIISNNDTYGLHLISIDYKTSRITDKTPCKLLSLHAISPNVLTTNVNDTRQFNILENDDNMHLAVTNAAKLPNILGAEQFAVKNTNLTCNYELKDIVYDKYLNFRDGNFIYDYMELGNIITEHALVADSEEAYISNLSYTINREDFFNSNADDDIMSKYYIGYVVLYKGHIVSHNEVNTDTLDVVWNPLSVLPGGIHDEFISASVDIFDNELSFVITKADLENINSKINSYNQAFDDYNNALNDESITVSGLKEYEKTLSNAEDEMLLASGNAEHYEYLPYEIIFTCRKENGFKYYSNPTTVNVIIALNNISDNEDEPAYRYDIDTYYVNVSYPGALDPDLSDSTDLSIVKCNFDGLTADAQTNIPIDILVQDGFQITKIIINNQLVYNSADPNFIAPNEIKTNWFQLSLTNDSPTGIDEDTEHDLDEYINFGRYLLTVSDNIPDIEIDGTKYTTTSAQQYMTLLSDTNLTGANSLLFQLLDSRRGPVSTSKRSFMIQVYYNVPVNSFDYDDAEMDDNYIPDTIEVHNNFIITQPGFNDPRQIPDINMTLQRGLIELEETNNKSNGVLCNQFRTYLDLNINNFTKLDWGLYGSENITMDIKIKNYPYDNAVIERYQIESPNRDATVKLMIYDAFMVAKQNILNTVGSNLAFNDKVINRSAVVNLMTELQTSNIATLTDSYVNMIETDMTAANCNLFAIKEDNYPAWSGIYTNKQPNNDSADNLISNTPFWLPNYYALNIHKESGAETAECEISNDVYITARNEATKLSDESIFESSKGHKYIFINNEVINANNQNIKGISGLYHDITIDLKNISIEDAESGTIRFAVDFEMGNPIIAIFNLQFYVESIIIKIKSDDDTEHRFVLNSAEPLSPLNNKIIAGKAVDYRFKTDKLIASINPVSLIASPVNSNIAANSGLVKITGSSEVLKTETKFFNESLYYSLDKLMSKLTNTKRRLQYTTQWNSFNLKTSYFQDNITDIKISAIHPSELDIDKVSNYIPYNQFMHDNILAPCEEPDISNAYFNIMFDADGFFNPKKRQDVDTFYYNDEELLAARYNQKTNNCPIFAPVSGKLNVRSQKEINSMDIWNFEYYAAIKNKYPDVHCFAGKNNEYGNGYQYLNYSFDTGQYAKNETVDVTISNTINGEVISDIVKTYKENEEYFSLFDLQTMMNRYCTKLSDIQNINHSMSNTEHFPDTSESLYRSCVYDMAWQYPWYANEQSINHAPLISPFDFLLYYIVYLNDNQLASEEPVFTLPQKYKDHINAISKFAYGENTVAVSDTYIPGTEDMSQQELNIMPYNFCYDISPRMAYNYENDTYNVLMLRRPVIGYDTDDLTEIENYIMQRCYLSDSIQANDIIKHHSTKPYDANIVEN